MLHSYAIFCDDVRQETTGKTIFVGVYKDQMLFAGDAPWRHLMLNVYIVFRTPRQDPMPTLELELRATDEDRTQKLFHIDIPHDAADMTAAQLLPFERDVPQSFSATFTVTLSPLVFDKPTKLAIYSIVDGEETLIDRLRVDKNANA